MKRKLSPPDSTQPTGVTLSILLERDKSSWKATCLEYGKYYRARSRKAAVMKVLEATVSIVNDTMWATSNCKRKNAGPDKWVKFNKSKEIRDVHVNQIYLHGGIPITPRMRKLC